MINDTLSKWIAQSESWQTFIDFKLPEDSIASYKFLDRPDDFYISLFGSLYEVLENPEASKEDILSIAKGLEIYSLETKKHSFNGINQANNILFASGLYYLADYSSSACILAKLFSFEDYQTDIEKFMLSFLNRRKLKKNVYRDLLNQYLENGNIKLLNKLIEQLTEEKEKAFNNNPMQFSLFFLAENILLKFKNSNIWIDLLKYNSHEYWELYIDKSINKSFPVWDFFPSQKKALEKGILGNYKSMALQTPTSSGKTAICELLIYNEFQKNSDCKVLYLAPYRALASELKQTFGKNLAKLGISSKTIYGGDIPTIEEKKVIQDVNLLIATPEKFMALENIAADFSKNFTIIICDEGHLIDSDGNRGLSYELLLSRLKKENTKKFIFISAIIPNIGSINKWLGGNELNIVTSDYRSTEIEYAFVKPIDDTEKKFLLIVNPLHEIPKKYILNNFLTENDFTYHKQQKKEVVDKIYKYTSAKTKSVAIALKALNSGTAALFSPSKGGKTGVMALAEEAISQIDYGIELTKALNLNERTEDKNNLKEYFKVIFGEDYLLSKIVDYGILFHHGDLPQYVREIIEEYIRTEKIKLIICTNTLAEGVNLPIKTIVIYSTRRYNYEDEVWENLNLRDLKNLFGRAGRAGKQTKGLIIITNKDDFRNVEKVIKEKDIEKVEGYLYTIIKEITLNIKIKSIILTNEILEKQSEKFKELVDIIDISVIDLLGEDLQVETLENEIQNLISETFAFFQANEEEKNTLKSLIKLRGQKIEPYIRNKEFSFIKKSSSTIRMYEELKDNLDLENSIWLETNNPSDNVWIDFIMDIALKLSIVKYQLEKFNLYNFKNNTEKYITLRDLKETIKAWINGLWFKEISGICDNNIDISLRLINSFIGYNLQSIISSVIQIVELKLKEKQIEISQVILDFPQYLLYGLQNRVQLDLVEIGFTDRIGIIKLSEIINKGNIKYSNLSKFKYILNNNKTYIINEIKDVLPQISLHKIITSFNYLEYENIF